MLWHTPFMTQFKEKTKKVCEKFGGTEKSNYLCTRLQEVRALSSVGLERLPYKQRVGGSNPSAPTKKSRIICETSFVLSIFIIIYSAVCTKIPNFAPYIHL